MRSLCRDPGLCFRFSSMEAASILGSIGLPPSISPVPACSKYSTPPDRCCRCRCAEPAVMIRVALFTDSYDEANGVATTSRALGDFARRRGLPFLSVRNGPQTGYGCEDSIAHVELKRGLASFAIEFDMRFDTLLWRYFRSTLQRVKAFGPDIIHVTGPGDIGLLGVAIAKALGLYVVGSWHTNLHDFAAWRLQRLLRGLPSAIQDP